MARPYHTKPDANQRRITEELRALGYDVDDVHNLPGLYDLVVSGMKSAHIYGREMLDNIPSSVRVEVKSEKGLMTDNELNYYHGLNHKRTYIVAYKTQDILDWFNGKS